MHLLTELNGKKVVDGAETEIGVVDGLNLVYPEYRVADVYLRVEGERLMEIRGRRLEFIPVEEIDVVEEEIRMYKDFNALKDVIKEVDMESQSQVFRAKDLVGEDVISFDHKNIGRVVDFGLGKRDRNPFLIVEGRLIKAIRGRERESIPVDEVVDIGDEIHINIQYDMLKKTILGSG
jgi:sporulation protein YlmC with PRC-barrel domain